MLSRFTAIFDAVGRKINTSAAKANPVIEKAALNFFENSRQAMQRQEADFERMGRAVEAVFEKRSLRKSHADPL